MRRNKGSTLLIALFVALVALSISISMMQLSSTKSVNAVNNKYSLQAFYAAESGLNEAIDTISDNLDLVADEATTEDYNLPDASNPASIGDAEYFVNVDYVDGDIVIDSTASYKGSKKKIRARIGFDIDSAFNYGMLSDQSIDVYTGNITFNIDMHGNESIAAKGNNLTNLNDAVASHGNPDYEASLKGSKGEDNSEFWGVYTKRVDVPGVDFEYFDEEVSNGVIPDSSENDLTQVNGIDNFDANVKFTADYLSGHSSINIPTPPATSSFNNVIPKNIIALLQDDRDKKVSGIALLALSQLGFASPAAQLCLLTPIDYSKYVISGGKGNANGNSDWDSTPTPEPTVEPTPEPEETFEDEEDSSSSGDDEFIDDNNDDEFVDESSQSNSNSGNNGGGNSSGNNGNNSGNGTGGTSAGNIGVYFPPGDYGGRIYYFDNKDVGDIQILLNGLVKNVVIVCTGNVTSSGAQHASEVTGQGNARGTIDTIIAAGGNIEHNGMMYTEAFYWANGNFTQSGQSEFNNGKVVAKGDIMVKGKMQLYSNADLADYAFLPKNLFVKSWQEIPAD